MHNKQKLFCSYTASLSYKDKNIIWYEIASTNSLRMGPQNEGLYQQKAAQSTNQEQTSDCW